MAALFRHLVAAGALAAGAAAAPPPPLAAALEYLRDQKSYSWEVINGDPGPVAQQFETRRGTVTTVQQNTSPNLKGQIDRQGDMLIRREWADGLRLDTIITAAGASVTNTPEGWLTDREILTAQAEERVQNQTPTPRFIWLRRADRPEIRRPDQELPPLLKSSATFEGAGDSYVVRARSRSSEEDADPTPSVTVTMNLRGGMIRDYEVKIEGTQRSGRSRLAIPVSDQRIVIITYVPVTRIDIPAAAQEKLNASRAAGARRP